MGTGYISRFVVEIEGTIEEDVGTNNLDVIIKELELICARYKLDISIEYPNR